MTVFLIYLALWIAAMCATAFVAVNLLNINKGDEDE